MINVLHLAWDMIQTYPWFVFFSGVSFTVAVYYAVKCIKSCFRLWDLKRYL